MYMDRLLTIPRLRTVNLHFLSFYCGCKAWYKANYNLALKCLNDDLAT